MTGANHALDATQPPTHSKNHAIGSSLDGRDLHLSDRKSGWATTRSARREISTLEPQMKRLLAVVGLALCLTAAQASANILFTFSGVTFNDGGTLTGTFTTNDALDTLVSFDITTSAGVGIGFHYTTATAGSPSTSLPFILVLSTASLDNILEVTFNGGLTALGAPILIGVADSFEQGTPPARREITAGAAVVAEVLEPSTIALLAIGVLGLLSCAPRRRQA